tara:strand:+ start:124 stop:330 length:207 start_codon:yes stop_codon:yes gene_type:complete
MRKTPGFVPDHAAEDAAVNDALRGEVDVNTEARRFTSRAETTAQVVTARSDTKGRREEDGYGKTRSAT